MIRPRDLHFYLATATLAWLVVIFELDLVAALAAYLWTGAAWVIGSFIMYAGDEERT